MLYERWLETVHEFGDRLALDDRINQRRWTFVDLAAAVKQRPHTEGGICFLQGRDVHFLLELLVAWRDNIVVCPLEADEPIPDLPGPLPSGIVHLKQTSGTTATKRCVLFTAEQLAADANNIVATMGLTPDSPNLGVISLAHSYGFSNLALPLLLHGVPLTLAESPLPAAMRAAADTGDNWTVPAVPALWQTWADADAIPRNLRLAISAGAPLPLALEERILTQTGVKIHNFLGSSECGGIAFDATDECRPEPGIAGAPLANVELSISESGCIEVRGPAVGSGYWPEAHESLQHGRFETQDLAEWDGNTLALRGRASDIINVSGRKVSPERIEQVLQAHESVRRCVVFGVPAASHAKNEEIIACVEWEDTAEEVALRNHAMDLLQSWESPAAIVEVRRISTDARGKISRRAWRDRYLAGEI